MQLTMNMLKNHCVDMKEEAEETVETREQSQEKGLIIWSEQSVFGAWMLSDDYMSFVRVF